MEELPPSRFRARAQFKNDFHVLNRAKNELARLFATKYVKVFLSAHAAFIEILGFVVRRGQLYRMRQSALGCRQPIFRNWELMGGELDELGITPISWFKQQYVAARIRRFVVIFRIGGIQIRPALLALAMPIDIGHDSAKFVANGLRASGKRTHQDRQSYAADRCSHAGIE